MSPDLKLQDKVCVIGTIVSSQRCLNNFEEAVEYEMMAEAAPEDDSIWGLAGKFKPDPTPILESLTKEVESVVNDSYYMSESNERVARTRAVLARAKAWLEG